MIVPVGVIKMTTSTGFFYFEPSSQARVEPDWDKKAYIPHDAEIFTGNPLLFERRDIIIESLWKRIPGDSEEIAHLFYLPALPPPMPQPPKPPASILADYIHSGIPSRRRWRVRTGTIVYKKFIGIKGGLFHYKVTYVPNTTFLQWYREYEQWKKDYFEAVREKNLRELGDAFIGRFSYDHRCNDFATGAGFRGVKRFHGGKVLYVRDDLKQRIRNNKIIIRVKNEKDIPHIIGKGGRMLREIKEFFGIPQDVRIIVKEVK